jgi:hypothetical protein
LFSPYSPVVDLEPLFLPFLPRDSYPALYRRRSSALQRRLSLSLFTRVATTRPCHLNPCRCRLRSPAALFKTGHGCLPCPHASFALRFALPVGWFGQLPVSSFRYDSVTLYSEKVSSAIYVRFIGCFNLRRSWFLAMMSFLATISLVHRQMTTPTMTQLLMTVALLIHDHNENHCPRKQGSVKGHVMTMDRKRDVSHVQLYGDYSIVPTHSILPLCSGDGSGYQDRCSSAL